MFGTNIQLCKNTTASKLAGSPVTSKTLNTNTKQYKVAYSNYNYQNHFLIIFYFFYYWLTHQCVQTFNAKT